MKRPETLWQATVLFLVLLMTVGIYVVLGWLLARSRVAGQTAHPPPVSQNLPRVQIVDPLNGAAYGSASPISVRAAVMEPGYATAELQVDGHRVSINVNPDTQIVPWVVDWEWMEPTEGSHVLAVQVRHADGDVTSSLPVTVTVVPEGGVVFASNRDGAYALYGMRTDGNAVVRLTGGPGDARQPAISEDGLLAYVAQSEGGRSVIRMLDRDVGNGVDLLVGVDPAWASDGAHLAYSATVDGVSQVHRADAGHGVPEQVTDEAVYAGQPNWLPDNTRLAYVAEQDGNWDIWTAALDGSEAHRLTEDPAMDWGPAWSPDGSEVAFVSNRGGSHQIHVMRSDGTRIRVLSDFPGGAEGPTWSPDGFWLAFVAYTGEGAGINAREIYLMRSDGQNQVRLTQNAHDDTEVDW